MKFREQPLPVGALQMPGQGAPLVPGETEMPTHVVDELRVVDEQRETRVGY